MQPCSPFTAYRYWSTAIRNTLRFRPGEFFCPLSRKPFFRYVIILCLYQQVSTAPALIFICISKYPVSTLKFCLYQQVSITTNLICVCISKYPVPPHSVVCISKYPQTQKQFVSVSTSIQCLHTHVFLYQQVSTAPTAILSISASIQCLHTQVFLYQQVSTGPTLLYICISQYPQPQPSLYLYQPVSTAPNRIVSVSAGISSLHVQHTRGARPEQRATPVSVRGRGGSEDREQQWQRVLLQQLPGAVPLGAHGQAVPVRSVLLPHR